MMREILLSACLTIGTALYAQESFFDKYTFSSIDMSNGLPHNYVDDLCQDDAGFMWIATGGGGLARYDGYGFEIYDVTTTQKIRSNFVHAVLCDKHRRLWIASDNGIDVLDLNTKTMLTDELLPDGSEFDIDRFVSHMRADNEGNIWFISHDKLGIMTFDSEGSPTNVAWLDGSRDFTALDLVGSTMWTASFSSIYMAQYNDGKIVLEQITQQTIAESGSMVATFFAKDNEVWVGTDGGLYRLNMMSGQMKFYSSDPDDPTSLSQNRVTSICETPQHEMVVATLKGINIYNSFTDSFEQVLAESDGMHRSISCNFINCLYSDGDILWLGTEMCGIDIVIPNDLNIFNYVSSNDPSSIAPNPVNAIVEDGTGSLWVGTVESGLNIKRPGSDRFEHLTVQSHGLSHNSISALDIDNNNELWVGTWGGGVNIVDLNDKNYRVKSVVSDLKSPFVGSIVYDHLNDGVWVGTVYEIAFVRHGHVTRPIHDPTVMNMAGALGSCIDDKDRLWMGTSNALVRIDLATMNEDSVEYDIYASKLDEPGSPYAPHITCIYQTKDGTIYIGTDGYGFYRYSENGDEDESFYAITSNDGLVNNCVKGIVEDASGNLWVTTNYGLSYYNVQNEKFINFTVKNGLLSDTYYWNATYKAPSTGNIYFGSVLGLSEIRRRTNVIVSDEMPIDKPVFTDLMVDNVRATVPGDYLEADISCSDRIVMHERDKSFAVSFAALNYKAPDRVRYQYTLTGFDNRWIDASSSHRTASYTNLRAGTYTLLVRCADNMSEWSDPQQIEIVIRPYFYKTVWFYLLMIVVISFIVWRIYFMRTRSLLEQQALLNLQVEERTKEIETQKEALENKTLELQRQNVMLSEQNQKITEQKEDIIQMSEKIQKLTADKMQFFTNISHEFRSPITLIIGPIQRALKISTNPKVREQLQLVERNSQHLLELVNQLMDFRKVESGDFDLHPTAGKLMPFVADIIHPFAVYASERGISLDLFSRITTEPLMFDGDAINKILTNLLSNAVKFTPDGGRIQLFIAEIRLGDQRTIYISVRDNGPGIPEADLEKIFVRFYQADNQSASQSYGQSSTGIGLYLVRKLVTQMEGEIYARNNRAGGCSFRLTLPLIEGVEAPQEDEDKDELDIEEEETVASGSKLTVLVVEDNADMRQYVRTILCEQYNVLEAKDGVVGLAVLAENDVDFIICDIMMPVMDGLEFSRKVKDNLSYSHIPILILTAQMSDEIRTESYKLGVDSYLHKPFDEQMLLARISGILEGRKNSQSKFQYSLDTDDLNIDRESEDDKFIRRVIEHVRTHYTNPDYAIDDILHDLGCSKSMLNKKMQSVIGLSPGVFIRSYRLNIAKQLILHNKEKRTMNISQIAYEVGFNDPKYFTRCFTKHFNITPSALLDSGHIDKVAPDADISKYFDAPPDVQ